MQLLTNYGILASQKKEFSYKGPALSFDGVNDYVVLPSGFSNATFMEFDVIDPDSSIVVAKGGGSFSFSRVRYRHTILERPEEADPESDPIDLGNSFMNYDSRQSSWTYRRLTFPRTPLPVTVKINLATAEAFVNNTSVGVLQINSSNVSTQTWLNSGSTTQSWFGRWQFNLTSDITYFSGFYTRVAFKDANENIISQYLFDEGSGTTLNDSVGNNNGTILNGATWVQF